MPGALSLNAGTSFASLGSEDVTPLQPSERRTALIVNARSRRGRRLFEEARAGLERQGLRIEAAEAVHAPERLAGVVTEMIETGFDHLVVGGGDGTLSTAADLLAHRPATLGILPLGTANSFARALGIPLDLEQAVAVAAHGRMAEVDLLRVGERYVANAMAMGLPVRLSRATPHLLKKLTGKIGYALVAAALIARYRGFACSVSCDGTPMRFHVLDLRIANGGYQGGVLVAEGASVDSGELLLRIIEGRSPWPLVSAWASWLTGRQPARHVRMMRCREVSIEAQPTQQVAADGEIFTRTPISVSIAARALRVIVTR